MKIFDRRIHETHMVDINKETQTKPLHENLHHTFSKKKPSSHTFEQESMEISFSRRDPIIGELPLHVPEIEGNSVVMSRDYLVPHAEEGGALAPNRGMLASLQGSP